MFKVKITFWRVVLALLLVAGAYATLLRFLSRLGRFHQPQRCVPLGHLDWL